ncbi:MAG: prolyl oligopeptidase family serine peptidase [Nitrospirota bacterium]|nr:MAG: prolyl oligopeptidase family serine peptidase [Nitrospirota bacterium]
MSWKLLYWILGFIVFLPLFNLLLGVHPPRFETDDDPKKYGLDYELVSFPTSDGLTLRGWFIPAATVLGEGLQQGEMAWNPCATILVGHGYPFDKANILRHALFLHPRFHLLVFDFRYFGESEGSYTTAGLLETLDVQAAVEYVKSRSDVNPESIGALGFSMSASAFILTRHPDVKAIVADSPYATLEGLVARQFFFLPGFTKWPLVAMTKLYARLLLGVRVSDAAPVDVVRELNTPLLIIHGDADSQIPIGHSQIIYANAVHDKTTFWIVPGADHGFAHGLEGPRYEVRVRQFFEQHLCTPALSQPGKTRQ